MAAGNAGVSTQQPDDRPIRDGDSIQFLDGVDVEKTVLERQLPRVRAWMVVAGGLLIAAFALIVGLLSGGDSSQAPAVVEAPTTVPSASSVPTTAGPPQPTLPEALTAGLGDTVSLPAARPAAELVGISGSTVVHLDLVSGAAAIEAGPDGVEGATILDVDGALIVFSSRRLVRITDDGTALELASGVHEVHRAFEPAGVVTVSRDALGQAVRLIGADGAFRAGIRVSPLVRVVGAIGDRFILEAGGQVVASDSSGSISLGSGEVLAIGASSIVRATCDIDLFCSLVTGTVESPQAYSVAVPSELGPLDPTFWGEGAELSPDGSRLSFYIRYGSGNARGLLVVDLADGSTVHSPEVSPGFGSYAWAPDNRFVLYEFDGDVMVWDTLAPEGTLPSVRILMHGVALEELVLRPPGP